LNTKILLLNDVLKTTAVHDLYCLFIVKK